ncbi:hypothetical protein HYH03_006464 [Edaphochlamys debaryana]|uniref:Uncharacterized protein n=1 Tax=Edaphochlamys debaryana TaxID=47281 RepID=A0A836C075_9CHLO|nr:hypothetical protein HYH03_006464 [Edaphochlamys debaryana]|eukprot:KAG2495521.1 hypothetical protein HYH03_006464 [Edaphochlamys debaryana]
MAQRQRSPLRFGLVVAGLLPLSAGVLVTLPPALASESTDDGSSTVIGIDLGATHASVGVYHNNRTQVIANALGSRVTPAYVAFTDTGRLVGEAARDRALLDPKRTVYGVKHLLGRTFTKPQVQRLRDLVPYNIVDRDGKPYISVEMDGEQHVYSPEEISAMVLSEMKETAESFLGSTVKHAVIAVPASCTDVERQALKDAGALAGLNVIRIINEPTAAGLAYGLGKKQGETNALVFHLGGSTLDVSVLLVDNGVFEVLSSTGETHLGGKDFTRRVVDHLVGVVRSKYGRDVSGDARAMQRLWREAERAKQALSTLTEVRVEFPGLTEGVDLSEPLSRARFEELNRDLFKTAVGAIGKALEAAEVSKTDINEILLVGGSSRIPRIQDLVKEWFDGKEAVRAEGIEPDEAVTHGAAEQGGILSGAINDGFGQGCCPFYNVAPLTIGIETAGGLFAKIIPRNTLLPTRKARVFSTEEDNQETVIIKVYEGERSLARDNHWLGQIELRGIPPAPRGVPQIEVMFDVHYDGNFTLSGKDLDTGREEKIEISQTESRWTWEDVDRIVREADALTERDQAVRAQIEAHNQLTGHCYSVASTAGDAMQGYHSHGEDTQTSAAVQKALDWLDANPDAGPEDTKARYQALAHACRPILAERLAAGPATGLVGPLETAAPEQEGDTVIVVRDESGLLPLSAGVIITLPPELANDRSDGEFTTVIGIDLGATHASVGVYQNNRTQVIANALGSRVTPAYVAFADTGRLVGEAARDRALLDPKRTVYGVKHLLGRTFDDPEVQRLRDLVPYDIVEQDGKPYISIGMKDGKQHLYSPEEISAIIIAEMKETAESFLGKTVKHAVISVPAHSTEYSRQATKDAGMLAGLHELRITNEPAAAVIAHGLDKKDGDYYYHLVFHLGGSTLDVSVVSVDYGIMDTFSSTGDSHLGGQDFTRRVVDHLVGVVRSKYGRDVAGDARAMQRLWREAERAKQALSGSTEVRVEVLGLTEGVDLSEPLSRARFEELNKDLFEKAVGAIGKALEAAEVNKSEIIEILMVGGSSRIPRIRDLVKEWFDGKEPFRAEGIEPDEAVTHGAAERGAILSGAIYQPRQMFIHEVAVLSMGIETTGGLMTMFVARGTLLPPSRRRKVFSTEEDSQETVVIKIYEGERSLARDNHWLGQIELRGIPPGPRGVPRIEVTFNVAEEGNFTVTAKDLHTGREETIDIRETEGHRPWEEVERRLLESEAVAEQDQAVRAQIEARNRLTGRCYSIRSAVRDVVHEDQLHGEDTDQMSAAVREALDWLEANPGAGPEEARLSTLAGACKPILAERLAAGPATGLVGPLETAAPEPEGAMVIPEEDEGGEDSSYNEPYPDPSHGEL